jgi:hypothetical protein
MPIIQLEYGTGKNMVSFAGFQNGNRRGLSGLIQCRNLKAACAYREQEKT